MAPLEGSTFEGFALLDEMGKKLLDDLNSSDDAATKMKQRVDGGGEAVAGAYKYIPVRGVLYDDFINSVLNFKGGKNPELAEQAFQLWKDEKWKQLEEFFIQNNLNNRGGVIYPPNYGAVGKKTITLNPGEQNANLIDRFGDPNGKYVSPANTPLEQRALPSSMDDQVPSIYKIIEPIEGVEEGIIIPWFGKPGMGKQFRLPQPLQYYLDKKIIVPL